jgi:hypothetical protein
LHAAAASVLLVLVLASGHERPLRAQAASQGLTIHVTAGGSGSGTAEAPLGSIQHALDIAGPGDTIEVGAGEFREALATRRSGLADSPILVRGQGARATLVTAPGRVVTVGHEWVAIRDLALDGQYGADDEVRISSAGHHAELRRVEVRRSGRDCIDMGAPADVTIADSVLHHCLNATGGRSDAHGIVAGAARRLTISNSEIHTFSGDGVQLDPSRSAPGWDEVTIENSFIWLAPLASAENGFPAGTVPGENAIDTKTLQSATRPRLSVRNSVFAGFRGGLITNMAAFNLKEHVDAVVDGVTVRDSEIAFRLRGPETTGALVRVSNAVIHDVAIAFRYEDDIQGLRVWHTTLGGAVARPFLRASSSGSVLDVRNLLLLGTALPSEAPASGSNRAVGETAFVDVARHDYRLRDGSPAIDRGAPIGGVALDRDGRPRQHGRAPDVGAHEWCGAACPPPRPLGNSRAVTP